MAFESIPLPGEPIPLGEFFLEDRRFTAVYFLYYRGEVVYVGQSRTLKLRIDGHMAEGVKVFDAVAFIRCGFNRLSMIESHYIRLLAPKYNNCALSKKTRERESWKLPDSRGRYRKSKFEGPPYKPGDEIKTVDASECILGDEDIGEFLNVSDRDVAEWLGAGKITNKSVMGLLYFMVDNRREVRRAQERFEEL